MPRRYVIRISREASSDLDSIFAYIAKEAPLNATRWIEQTLQSLESLRIFPQRYKVHRAIRKRGIEIRSMPILPFVAYYRIDEDAGIVRILTIRHGSRRPPRRFN